VPALPGSLAPGAISQLGTGTPLAAGDAVAIADALSAAAPGIARFPTPSELAKLPTAQRRQLVRQAFDSPLRKQRLRQLRKVIRRYGGCFGALPDRGRRVLELRAGLFGEEPASRRVIAREIGTSPRGVLRLERSSLRRLISFGERGICGSGDAVAAAIGGLPMSSGGPGAPTGEGDGSDPRAAGGDGDPRPDGAVLADVAEGGPGIDLGDGEQGAAETLLFFLLALFAVLAPTAVMAIAAQRRSGQRHRTGPAR
jgi:hypothetical protein